MEAYPPTIPAEVTASTSVEALNLNWRERDLPERNRTKHVHRLHPYLGKFIPQLVEIFLRKFFEVGQTVLDPFAGSGTTLVQANELGINAVGCDISAFNVMLCRAKTAIYEEKLLRSEALDALNWVKVNTIRGERQLSLFDELEQVESEPDTTDEYLRLWFAPKSLRELLVYRNRIVAQAYTYADLLNVILSRSARSARLTTHFDLDFPKKPQSEPYWCYKHSRMCQPTQEAIQFIERYSLDSLARIQEFTDLRTNAHIQIIHGDSRTVSFGTVDGIITSPPYVGLIDYHQQHAYAYHLLGLQDRRVDEIGAAEKGSGKKAQARYVEAMVAVFQNALKSVRVGGRLIIVAADRHNLYTTIAQQLNIIEETIIQRHVNRRTGRRAGEFYETIFVWRKV